MKKDVEQIIDPGRRYGAWAGFPKGHARNVDNCAEQVYSNDREMRSYQCNRKKGHGYRGEFCKQHALKYPALGTPVVYAYRVSRWADGGITKQEIQGWTKEFVTLKNGTREKRQSQHDSWFETFDEAREFVLSRAIRAIKSAQKTIVTHEALIERWCDAEDVE